MFLESIVKTRSKAIQSRIFQHIETQCQPYFFQGHRTVVHPNFPTSLALLYLCQWCYFVPLFGMSSPLSFWHIVIWSWTPSSDINDAITHVANSSEYKVLFLSLCMFPQRNKETVISCQLLKDGARLFISVCLCTSFGVRYTVNTQMFAKKIDMDPYLCAGISDLWIHNRCSCLTYNCNQYSDLLCRFF